MGGQANVVSDKNSGSLQPNLKINDKYPLAAVDNRY
jgi:hypothetical protein